MPCRRDSCNRVQAASPSSGRRRPDDGKTVAAAAVGNKSMSCTQQKCLLPPRSRRRASATALAWTTSIYTRQEECHAGLSTGVDLPTPPASRSGFDRFFVAVHERLKWFGLWYGSLRDSPYHRLLRGNVTVYWALMHSWGESAILRRSCVVFIYIYMRVCQLIVANIAFPKIQDEEHEKNKNLYLTFQEENEGF